MTRKDYTLRSIQAVDPNPSSFTFWRENTEEVIRLDKEGFHYKGEFIADAGEAHRLMLEFLRQQPQPEPQEPADEEITEWADAATEVPQEELDPEVCGWRRCFGEKEFADTIRAALAHWAQ